ncbi:Thyroid hormone receptor alpha-A [Frankliniella fusca]|uniref:Thyroid hormone receptor alpha-A n=1 Tax=Frankliniella fusca TaxID=407009 RepID=A0AAE1GRP7_9NEOP|nr:Thyroid hormone receptor alpha-A [Frankliniella fusca]
MRSRLSGDFGRDDDWCGLGPFSSLEAVSVSLDLGVAVDLGVDGVAAVGDDGVEAAVLAGRVVHDALPAVGLQQGVLALDDVAVALLLLVLVVAGVRVLHAVLELVLGVRLEQPRHGSG